LGIFAIGEPLGSGEGKGTWKPGLKAGDVTDPRFGGILEKIGAGVSFAGEVALITGVASPQAIAHRTAANFLSAGGTVVGCDVVPLDGSNPLAAAAEAGGGRLYPVRLDQSDFADLDALLAALRERKLRVTHLVPFAGLNNPKFLSQITPEDLQRVIGVNVFGVYYLAGQFPRVANAAARWKVILPLSPNDGRLPGSGIYPATKKALEPLVIQGQAEMGARVKKGRPGGAFIGIRMGWVRSIMLAALEGVAEKARARGLRTYLPEEMGDVVPCLMPPAADGLGGTVLDVTGGFGALSLKEFAELLKGEGRANGPAGPAGGRGHLLGPGLRWQRRRVRDIGRSLAHVDRRRGRRRLHLALRRRNRLGRVVAHLALPAAHRHHRAQGHRRRGPRQEAERPGLLRLGNEERRRGDRRRFPVHVYPQPPFANVQLILVDEDHRLLRGRIEASLATTDRCGGRPLRAIKNQSLVRRDPELDGGLLALPEHRSFFIETQAGLATGDDHAAQVSRRLARRGEVLNANRQRSGHRLPPYLAAAAPAPRPATGVVTRRVQAYRQADGRARRSAAWEWASAP